MLLTLIRFGSHGQDAAMLPSSAMQEVGDVYPQCRRDVKQVRELHLGAGFHALDRRPVELGRVREHLLGHVEVQPAHADAVADGPAGVDDPLGLFGWHASNALSIMIISQQQI
jgi:hypothetical protein